ncbi:MAG: PQQ-dependent sugar dehydrogenase [Nocardioidaceae bacterium]
MTGSARTGRTGTLPDRRRAGCLVAVAMAAGLLASCGGTSPQPDADRPDDPGTVTATLPAPPTPSSRDVTVAATIADRLTVPWGLAFLPDGAALVTQRDAGTISLIADGEVSEVGRIAETSPTSEGGLLGIAVSPDYATDRLVFVYVTTSSDNRVLSMTFDGRSIREVTPILTGIPRGDIHDGGRLAFGPDGFLYVSTGENGNGALAQDPDSLGGKILRITPDGRPAPGNPDPTSPVWTLGHRNVQGLAFDRQGRLWATEFGSQIWDEINLIRKGNNYGWPAAEGDANLPGFTDPLLQWRPETASPSSVAYADGELWVASLRGTRLWEVPIERDGTLGEPTAHFIGTYGRLRTVTAAPDGSLWLGTSNRDGRGDPAPEDDRILRVSLT